MPEPATHHISGLHSRGYLPHLKSEGKSYFVTFRIAGTLPKNILLEFKKEREAIVQKANATRRSLTRAEQQELFYWYSARVDAYLDTSNINCWLKNHAIAKLVHDALLHFNGQRYLLHAWVIMSNHVHVVVRPAENHNLSKILHT
jgi:hypothetical protein